VLTSLALLTWLAGCDAGYGFTAMVEEGDGSGRELETDTDTDSDTDSDTEPPPSAPEITDLTLIEGSEILEVHFSVTDVDADLSGGKVRLDVDGSNTNYVLPTDLDAWVPPDGRIDLSFVACDDAGATRTVGLQPQDAGGLWGTRWEDSLVLSGSGHRSIDTGDNRASAETLGLLHPPVAICGDVHSASHSGSSYTGDLDYLAFTASSTSVWTFDLTWDDTADYDLVLLDSSGGTLSAAQTEGTTQPERVYSKLTAGETYYLVVAAWAGNATTWQIEGS